MEDVEMRDWVLSVHDTHPPERLPGVAAGENAVAHQGVWWAVINVEAPEWDPPDSVWPEQDMAKARAEKKNEGRYPSFHSVPCVAALWMRNEFPPE